MCVTVYFISLLLFYSWVFHCLDIFSFQYWIEVMILDFLALFLVLVKSLSRVRLSATPWTVAYQAPPSMEFSRQEYWSGLPFPSPGYLPDPGIEPGSPTLQADALSSEPPGKPFLVLVWANYRLLDVLLKIEKIPFHLYYAEDFIMIRYWILANIFHTYWDDHNNFLLCTFDVNYFYFQIKSYIYKISYSFLILLNTVC